ncbi:MAG: bifunctional 3-deoxy-7-phosphoheptulonate synthase/chorismate mutase [Acidobacteriota bacterium]|jgi:chorismate mutase/prephenate dehydratase|nr:bifunctional 3-deoxy-7-phosphoheptulonate synthase/chorismate mutase [Acidobacteriota bacterium]NLT32826.1 bifunctional 3-deoxy-7-phosphoheptulonate synthase/chorismate mutase [Acidobacteriota bacterium]
MEELEKIRSEINRVDEAILEALAARRTLSRRVIEAKDRSGAPIRDAAREEMLLSDLISKGRGRGLDAHLVTRVFQEIIDDSVRSQQLHLQGYAQSDLKRVVFQGIEGAYGDLAARKYFAPYLDRTFFEGVPGLRQVIGAVEDGDADYALVPVENTAAGSINEVYDLLSVSQLSIVGEEVLRIEHCLLGLPEAQLAGIRRIYSHPQALAECVKFVARLPDCQAIPWPDAAMAVRKVGEDRDPSVAAVGSEEAGRLYGLKVLQRNIEDQPHNFTRFLVLARKPAKVDRRIPCKTSLIMATSHEEGSLLKALSILYEHGINLLKLESRPIPGMPFQYLFYLDFEGNAAEERVAGALEKLHSATTSMKFLGSYPMQQRPRTAPRIETLAAGGPREEGEQTEPIPEKKEKSGLRLVGRDARPEDTVIAVGGARIGGDGFVVIGGPCAVESREQILQCARFVKECGGQLLRGGCFKPRTSPYSFQGLGFEALEMLAEAGREYDLPVVTEVLSPSDVEPVARLADILQIGARNMQNFSLLAEVGRSNRPVLLKRGMMSTLDEFLNAAEYIMAGGNHRVILCERGIRTFETATRNTLDLGSIPILRRMTHLPILVDPSHAAGRRDLVIPLALAARAVGPHGLIVEMHPDPDHAMSDGPQSLHFHEFADLMSRLYGG